ncbi:methyltransferase domain-containing protein [Legionella maioricensis]|uniref:Class I SAM-dependent methyltransferase n=1 Tax=Legionella maioricensis TaxID=2896528 RepID=A0A9X2D0J5_9GAMM|nr:methyltransferase domain-containing protein [Legionella maioricensis]MCL9683880.1 class I SAM-dependent methyltransferase [Legionella maioricensis]MCL9686727.1 class I SAM-dependent methyltransferase [Legionella maioricensis]
MGNDVAWDPEQYVLGNYFQSEINDAFRKRFKVKPRGTVLDIGCGDGQYTSMLANTVKHGQILGIDSSEEMIRYANLHWARKNLSFEVHNIEEFECAPIFDFILSFWCLHWTRIEESFPNIFHALKEGGRVYAVFSSFSDNSILQVWHELAKQNRYKDLTDRFINPNYQHTKYFYRVLTVLNQLPFKQVKLNLKTVTVNFPNINYFKNLLLTMPFMNTFPAESIEGLLEEMLQAFQTICQRKYGGRLYYETRPIFLEAIK